MACVVRFVTEEDGSILLGLRVFADDASHGYSFPNYVHWQGVSWNGLLAFGDTNNFHLQCSQRGHRRFTTFNADRKQVVVVDIINPFSPSMKHNYDKTLHNYWFSNVFRRPWNQKLGCCLQTYFFLVKALHIFFSNVYFIRNLMFFPSKHKKVQTYTNTLSV